MTTFLAVLRSGGEYRPEHVTALRDGIRHYLPGARFRCLSDVPVPGVETIPLRCSWPGWWAKLELFRPGLFFGRLVYIDLDSVVVGDLSDLAAYSGHFAMLSDFFHPERPASGVMAWEADCDEARRVWEAFMADTALAMRIRGGDQAFIRAVMGDGVARLQDAVPGIVSYKVHCKEGVPPDARLVCFHGRPRPWDTELWQPARAA
ncbi:MAG TPA: hypothetical protein VF167_02880 [Longimicrobiaceae bacterium]